MTMIHAKYFTGVGPIILMLLVVMIYDSGGIAAFLDIFSNITWFSITGLLTFLGVGFTYVGIKNHVNNLTQWSLAIFFFTGLPLISFAFGVGGSFFLWTVIAAPAISLILLIAGIIAPAERMSLAS